MCDKVILENSGMLMFVPNYYKNQKMCNNSVDNYAHALEFVLDCFKIQKMCSKTINTYPSAMQFVSNCYKTQEMCAKAVDTCPFVFDSVPDREMCNKHDMKRDLMSPLSSQVSPIIQGSKVPSFN